MHGLVKRFGQAVLSTHHIHGRGSTCVGWFHGFAVVPGILFGETTRLDGCHGGDNMPVNFLADRKRRHLEDMVRRDAYIRPTDSTAT